jgi:hypothetical protein
MTDVTADEVTRLRARVTELETQLQAPDGTSSAPRHEGRARAILSTFLIVIACALAPLSATAVWASTQLSDTTQYVKTVAPLAHDPGVQREVADAVTTAIVENLNLDEVTKALLVSLASQNKVPPRIAAVMPGLAGPIVNGVEGFTRTQVEKVLASPEFATLWAEVNRAAHAQLVALLEGKQGGALSAQGDTVTLNLGPIIARVKEVLVAQGFTLAEKVPTVDRSFVLVQSDSVTKARGLYRVLNTLGAWLPIIALAIFAAGVFAAQDRRRALLRGALGVVFAMLLLGVALAVARALYAQSTPANVLTEATAGRVFDTLVHYLRTGLRATAVLGLIVALAAFVTGPSSASVRTRATLSTGFARLRGGAASAGWSTGRFGVAVHAHRKLLRAAVLVAGGLVLLFWTRPTVGVILGTAIVALLVLAVIEFLAEPPTDRDRAADLTADAATSTDLTDTLPQPTSTVPSPREGAEHVAPEPVTTGSVTKDPGARG